MNENMIKEIAEWFSASALEQIAKGGEQGASLIRKGRAPWDLSDEERKAADTFDQLARYCRIVVAMQS